MGDYVITGMYKNGMRLLVKVIGRVTEDVAIKILSDFIKYPNKEEKNLQLDHTDFRLKYVEPRDCWWRRY